MRIMCQWCRVILEEDLPGRTDNERVGECEECRKDIIGLYTMPNAKARLDERAETVRRTRASNGRP